MLLAQVALRHTPRTPALLLIDVVGYSSRNCVLQVTHPYSGHFVSLYDAHTLSCWSQKLRGLTQGNTKPLGKKAASCHWWHQLGIFVKTHNLTPRQEPLPRKEPVTCSVVVLGKVSLETLDC